MKRSTSLPKGHGIQVLNSLRPSLNEGTYQPTGLILDQESGTLSLDTFGNLWFRSSSSGACVMVYPRLQYGSAWNVSVPSATSPSTTKS
jgi:hypothetical protein